MQFRIAELPVRAFSPHFRMAKGTLPGVQSVERALQLLNLLAESPDESSLGDLARTAGLPTSTAHRLLGSLIRGGYVAQNPVTGRYGVGGQFVLLSRKGSQRQELIRLARPWLEQVARTTGETVNLTTRLDDSIIQLDHVDSANMLRVTWNAGERFPMHASASGKLFLAFLPPPERDRILKTAARHAFTSATLKRAQLKDALQTICAQGYALDDAEREDGVRCVAVPILDARGGIVAALSVSGPSLRLSVPMLHEMAQKLLPAARAISESLGYSGGSNHRTPH